MYASLEGHMDIIQYLCEERNADLYIKNKENQSVIDIAGENSNPKI